MLIRSAKHLRHDFRNLVFRNIELQRNAATGTGVLQADPGDPQTGLQTQKNPFPVPLEPKHFVVFPQCYGPVSELHTDATEGSHTETWL